MTWPPKFSLDGQQILTLLTGDRFYSSADASLREAVLNAVDACGRRRDVDPRSEPTILVQFDMNTRQLLVSDNGDGMDRQDITTLFARIGASASRVATKAASGQYKAVGEFGIGIVSYFLVSDRFEIHTRKESSDPIGLEFHRGMFNTETPAKELAPLRNERGTTLILHVKDHSLFQLLLQKYPHWMKSVRGLTARTVPDNKPVEQGGLSTRVRPLRFDLPDWIEAAEVGPPNTLDYWTVLDGYATIDILYRGVFVEKKKVPGYWGIEGSLHVDPKRFKPKLNREGFLPEGFEQSLNEFLQAIHPRILLAVLDEMRKQLTVNEAKPTEIDRWVTLWLAIPRTGVYGQVAKAWDDALQDLETFRLLTKGNETGISLRKLIAMNRQVYLAPQSDGAGPLVKKATNILRAKGEIVITGVSRKGDFLRGASLIANSTSDLLLNYFKTALVVTPVENVATDLVNKEEVIATVFKRPTVKLVKLGSSASALVGVGDELWINIESPVGKRLVVELCERNDGFLGLVVAANKLAPDLASEAMRLIRLMSEDAASPLTPVKRLYFRRLAS